MAEVFANYLISRWTRAIGQVSDASTEVALYTCGTTVKARGRVYWAERAGGTPTISIRLKNQAGDDNKQFIVNTHPLSAKEYDRTEELFLGPGDIIDVASSDANVSFTFNGFTEPVDT